MGCTTILVGKKASYDGSTMIARNSDSGAGNYTPKKLEMVRPKEQPRTYRSVISHVEIVLPEDPILYSSAPDALGENGIWGGAGVNEANVAMTATETIASNERVLGADPLVVLRESEGDAPESPGGIGEEDYLTIVLPYIRSAREGVLRTAELLEKYGTYEMNGIAFSDVDEIWWMETIGGHHWIARRVPDDRYVVMPNQSGIDFFDLEDAFGEKKEFMCSEDLREFIRENHLDLAMDADEGKDSRVTLNPRDVFGTHDDADHVYNTPRAWFMCRYFNPHSADWDGRGIFDERTGAPLKKYRPVDDDLPWSMVPERKITVEDIKYALSSHYQGTPYDPYAHSGDLSMRGCFRSIGIDRTDFLALLQLRPYVPAEICAVEWITFGSNVFNTFAAFYPNTDRVPDYLEETDEKVTTESYYWSCRLIAALADAQYTKNKVHIERYQIAAMSDAHRILKKYDAEISALLREDDREGGCVEERAAMLIGEANEELTDMLQRRTAEVLGKVLFETSNKMKNAFARSDA